MSKVYANDENDISKSNAPRAQDPQTEAASATCFSSEAEAKLKQNQAKPNKIVSGLEKITNTFSKSFIPPTTVDTTGSKWRDLRDRTIWTILMLLLFLFVISLGNFYCAFLVLLVMMAIYRELIDISRYKDRNNEVKHYYIISWYFFALCVYFFYIIMLMEKINYLEKYSLFYYMLRYHNLICFMLYIIGFFLFINSLTKGYYRYQFRQFAWIHIILFIFGIASALVISNIFTGLVWFILPATLVICNDISAYIWGRMFGKTQLSSLSPKKTVEGFIGGLFCTIIWCFIFTEIIICFDFLLCPIKEITAKPFVINECDTSDLRREFIISYELPLIGKMTLPFALKIMHFHTFILGLFASLLAPLGGLFASGFKRAIKIKDFADTIPGHGGLTDRMDCQILMGFFTYVWIYQFLLYDDKKQINNVIKMINKLHYDDQLIIFNYLRSSLGIGE